MARLTEAVTSEVQKRQCPPLETFFFTMRLQLWPVFQKVMSEHCEVLKKLAERPNGYFSKAPVTTDTTVLNVGSIDVDTSRNLHFPLVDLQTLYRHV
jgi:hypothetical protein